MIRFEDECVGCPPDLGCMGSACKYKDVPHLVCDECQMETTLYYFDGKQMCIDCIEEQLEEITIEEVLEKGDYEDEIR